MKIMKTETEYPKHVRDCLWAVLSYDDTMTLIKQLDAMMLLVDNDQGKLRALRNKLAEKLNHSMQIVGENNVTAQDELIAILAQLKAEKDT